MENEVVQNEVVEKTNKEKPKRNVKKILMITGTLVAFVLLLVLAITTFKAPRQVKFQAPGRLGFTEDAKLVDLETNKIKDFSTKDEQKLFDKLNKMFPHYYFLGWFLNSEGSGEAINLCEHEFEKTTTLYAIWDVIEYSIEYDYDGGKLDKGVSNPSFYTTIHDHITKSDEKHNNDEWHYDATKLQSYIMDPSLNLQVPKKDGSTFDHWEIADEKGNIINDTNEKQIRTNPKGNIKITAVWR